MTKKPIATYCYYDTHAKKVKIRNLETHENMTLLELAHENDINIPSSCGGNKACSTCHVIINQEYYEQIKTEREIDEEEEDMLEEASQKAQFSRLCCQLYPSEINKELTIRVVVPFKKSYLHSAAQSWSDTENIINFIRNFSFLSEISQQDDFILLPEHIADLQNTYVELLPRDNCAKSDLEKINSELHFP